MDPRSPNQARTSLASVALGLKMLESGTIGELTSAQKELLELMVSDVQRLSRLVDPDLDLESLLQLPRQQDRRSAAGRALPETEGLKDLGVVNLILRTRQGAVVCAEVDRLWWLSAELLDDLLSASVQTPAAAVRGALKEGQPALTTETPAAMKVESEGPDSEAPSPERTYFPGPSYLATSAEEAGTDPRIAPVSPAGEVQAPRPAPLRVCTLVASYVGFRTEEANSQRLEVASRALAWAALQGASMIAFPAGFLRARSERLEDIRRSVEELGAVAEREGVAMVLGVDACTPDWEDRHSIDAAVSMGALPYYAVAKSVHASAPLVFRQRSTSSTNWQAAPAASNDAVHYVSTGTHAVALILCGEALNVPIVAAVCRARPALVAVIAHWPEIGARRVPILSLPESRPVPLVRSVHASHAADNFLWKGHSKCGLPSAAARFHDGSFFARVAAFDVD